MKVDILGTEYIILQKNYDEEEAFARRGISGFCDGYTKEIVVCKMSTYTGWEHETEKTCEIAQKETLRHELVHAFLNESGLMDSSSMVERPWAQNEEMIDWIAIQGQKIYKAWEKVGAIG